MQGAAVLIIDESTGVPRTLETDARGSLRGAEPQARDLSRRGRRRRTSRSSRGRACSCEPPALRSWTSRSSSATSTRRSPSPADALNNITLESQAIARGLDEQQLHDLPRNSRDIQSFLLLNPNVVGGADDIQFLGAKTYGVSYIQDGQASTNAIFGTIGNSAPGLDAISEITVLSNSYSAEYGGLAGVVVTTKRGANSYRGTSFYDFNSDGLNALTYNQTLVGRRARRSRSPTPTSTGGAAASAVRSSSGKLFFYAQLRRLQQQSDLRRRRGRPFRRRPCAPATSAARRSRRAIRSPGCPSRIR